MKWFLLIVIALNLLVFSYGKRQTLAIQIKPNINANKIRLLPPNWSELEASSPASSSPATITLNENATSTKQLACFQWGKLKNHLVARIRSRLPATGINTKQISEQKLINNKKSRYLVYAKATNKEAAKQLADNLSANGFTAVLLKKNGVEILSLGEFAEQKHANALLKKAHDAGFEQVELKGGEESEYIISFNKLDEKQTTNLKTLQKRIAPSVDIKSTSC